MATRRHGNGGGDRPAIDLSREVEERIVRKHLQTYLNACSTSDEDLKRRIEEAPESVLGKTVKVTTNEHLHWACQLSDEDVRATLSGIQPRLKEELLISESENYGTILHCALVCGRPTLAKLIISGLDRGVLFKLLRCKFNGSSAFHVLCARAYTELLRVIVDSGLDKSYLRFLIGQKDSQSRTSLHLICTADDCDNVAIIFEALNQNTVFDLICDKSKSDAQGKTAFHVACAGDYDGIVQEFIKPLSVPHLKDIMKIEDTDGRTALHLACAGGCKKVVKIILERLSEIVPIGDWREMYDLLALKDSDGKSALHLAILRQHAETVRIIIEVLSKMSYAAFKEYVNHESQGQPIIAIMCINGQIFSNELKMILDTLKKDDIFEVMILKGAKGRTTFHELCKAGCDDRVKLVLEAIKSKRRDLLTATDDHKWTPLHMACAYGRQTVVKTILTPLKAQDKDGADNELVNEVLKAQDSDGKTAFHLACIRGYKEVVTVTMEHANMGCFNELLCMEDNQNNNTFKQIISSNRNEMVELCLSSKHHLTGGTLSRLQNDILYQACERGLRSQIAYILQAVERTNGPDDNLRQFLNASRPDGQTLLHIACKEGDIDLVRDILRYAQNLDLNEHDTRFSRELIMLMKRTDSQKRSVLHECSQQTDDKVLIMILDAAKSLKPKPIKKLLCAKDASHRTALWCAFEVSNHRILKSILDYVCLCSENDETLLKSVVTCTDNSRQTLLHRACRRDFQDMRCLETLVTAVRHNELLQELYKMKDEHGKTCFEYINETRQDIIESLLTQVIDDEKEEHKFETGVELITTMIQIPGGHPDVPCNLLTHVWKTKQKEEKPPFTEYADLEKWYSVNETLLLMDKVVLHRHSQLRKHKYLEDFARDHYNTLTRKYFRANMAIYVMLLASLTTFVTLHKYDCDCDNSTVAATPPTPSGQNEYVGESTCPPMNLPTPSGQNEYVARVAQCIVLMILALMAYLFDVIQLSVRTWSKRTKRDGDEIRRYWFYLEAGIDILVSMGAFAVACVPLIAEHNAGLHQIGIFIVLVAWLNGAWQMTKISYGKLKKISHMFTMLFRVMRSVVIFFPVFGLFIFSMALSYYNLFHCRQSSSHVGFAIMRSIATTIGELDFEEVFFSDKNPQESQSFFALSSIFFILFLGIMNISLMNLLIGTAVGDVSELKKKAELMDFNALLELIWESRDIHRLYVAIRKKLINNDKSAATNGNRK